MTTEHLRRVLFSALTLSEWTMYMMVKDTGVRQMEKLTIKSKILPRITQWVKNLESAQKTIEGKEDREKATGFFFDSLYLLNQLHPDDYDKFTKRLTDIVNDTNKQRSRKQG